jgi:hypothetical protein
VIHVGQSGEGGDLGGSGGVEGLTRFLQNGSDVGAGETIADAKGGKALDFGEGAKNDEGATFFYPLDGGGRFRNEFVVGFVEDETGAGGKFFDESGKLSIRNTGTGGIVGGGEKNEADIWGESCREACEVVMKIPIGDLFERNTEEASHKSVDGEGVGGGEDFTLSGQGVGVVTEFDNFV